MKIYNLTFGNRISRKWLLAGASSVAVALAGLPVSTIVIPSQAWAACDPGTSGVVNCTGTDATVDKNATGNISLIFRDETVTTNGVHVDGGDNSVSLSVMNTDIGGATINVSPITSNNDQGILFDNLDGAGSTVQITIQTGGPGGVVSATDATTDGNDQGVLILKNSTGSVNLNFGNTVNGGNGGIWVGATATTGSQPPNITAGTASSVTINAVDVHGTGTNANANDKAVFVRTTGANGAINITTTGNVTSGTSDGIHADNDSSAAITIEANNVTVGNSGGDSAIEAIGTTGNVKVTTHGTIGYNVGPGIGDIGIHAVTGGAGTIDVIATAGTVNGGTGTGGDDNFGIDAYSTGNGAITVTTTNATVNGGSGSATGTDWGLAASSSGGSTVLVDAGIVSATNGYGIFGQTTDTGTVTINAHKNVTASADGIHASTTGTGAVRVVTDANTTITGGSGGTGDGIDASSTGGGNVYVRNNGAVLGDPGVVLSAVLGGTVGYDINGDVTGNPEDAVHATSVDGATNIRMLTGTLASPADGIDATVTGTGAAVTAVDAPVAGLFVDQQGGSIGTSVTRVGGNGIIATMSGVTTHDLQVNSGAIWSTLDGVNAHMTNAGSSGNVIVNVNGAMNSSTDDGVDARNDGTGDVTVNVNAGGGITAGNNGGDAGVQAISSGGGDVFVNSVADTAISGFDYGIDARTLNGGDVTVITYGTVSSTGGAGFHDGIFASTTNGGHIKIETHAAVSGDPGINSVGSGGGTDIDTMGTTHGLIDGIRATEILTGQIDVDVYHDVTGDDGRGIWTTSVDGNTNINIHNTDNPVVVQAAGANGNGVDATTTGLGVIAITQDSGTTIGTSVTSVSQAGIVAALTGANATAGDGITIHQNGTIYAVEDGINASTVAGNEKNIVIDSRGNILSSTNDGIQAVTNGNGNITVDTRADITAGNGGGDAGIQANANGNGNVTVNVHIASDISATEDGIDATSNGSGAIAIDVWGDITQTVNGGADYNGIQATSLAAGTGGITIDTHGPSYIDAQGDGIDALIMNAANTSNITIRARGDILSHTDDGIAAQTNGSGNVGVEVWGDITAGNNGGDSGIEALAFGGGNVVVTTHFRSDISGSDHGIDAQATGGAGLGTVTMDLWGDVNTQGTELLATSTAVTGSSHITMHWTSDIGASNASDDLAIYGTGGAVLVDNYGSVRGRLDLATAGDTAHPNTVNNYSSNSWTFTGSSNFGAGLADVFNNTGTVHNLSGTPSNADVSNYDGLEFFNNGGSGYYDTGTIDLSDGYANDNIYVTPSATATLNYYGYNGNSYFDVDTYLADPGTSLSDRMKINGNVSGGTAVVVNDIGGTGAYNPNGITVVDVTGTASIGNFYLANGPITKGLWDYDMFLNSGNASGSDGDGSSANCDGTDNCYVIASYANVTAYNIASLAAIAQNAWSRTADGWIDRSGDLREYQLNGGTGPTGPMSMASGASKENGIWGRIVGVSGGRDQTTTVYPFPDQPVSFDTGYDDTLWGFQGGIDHSFATSGGGTMVVGLMGGYYENKVAFNSGNTARLTGPTVGIYADWINGGMYVDALLKADFLSAQFDGQDDWTSGTSFGGQIEAGNRIKMANNTFIEPVASLAYVNTSFDSVDFYGTDVSFKNGDSLRGKIGARFGADWTNGNAKVSPYVGAFLGNEFMGDNTVLLQSMGPDLTVHDDVSGLFGEVNAGVNVANLAGNATVFASGSYIFGGDYTAGVGKGGVRFQW